MPGNSGIFLRFMSIILSMMGLFFVNCSKACIIGKIFSIIGRGIPIAHGLNHTISCQWLLMPLGVDTQTHSYQHVNQSNFEKPGMAACKN